MIKNKALLQVGDKLLHQALRLPNDYTLTGGINYDSERGVWMFNVTSPRFPDTHSGQCLPYVNGTFHQEIFGDIQVEWNIDKQR